MKLLIFLIRPEIYEALEKDTSNAEYEMAGIEEIHDDQGRVQTNYDQEQFNLLVKSKTERLFNPQVVSRTSEGVQTNASAYDNPISISKI